MTLTQVQKDYIKTEIGIALGYASMCWEPVPSGVFQSEPAIAKVIDLYEKIMNELGDSK